MHSRDKRDTVVRVYKYLKSLRKTSLATGAAKSTIHRWLHASDDPQVQRGLQQHRFKKASLQVLHSIGQLVDNAPFVTTEDIRRHIAHRLRVDVSTSCVRCWLKRMSFSRKKATVSYTRPGLDAERHMFCSSYMKYLDPERVISIDETSIYLDMKPSYGYSRLPRLHRTTQTGGRARWTLILAVTNESVAGWIFSHALNQPVCGV